ncbi:hypothetical protein AJ78_01529 [Emergomyces pasteurianus Ep9510]|uniref:tRNA (uracil-O(2)-)-methyltransferase n=1 Tax=Emergomyces pasteurianus Ep9510 TaxID=1447872 RepID=A0A1J9PPW5_9EURO|nr:hypothetical protein AJ78_01529 [Emergomyces pasteurianus Ep9510]
MRSTENIHSRDGAIAPPDMTFGATLRHSFLSSSSKTWITSPQLSSTGEKFSMEAFLSVTTHLLANPNINCSHVFRADILYDSSGVIKSPKDKERAYCGSPSEKVDVCQTSTASPLSIPSESIPGFRLQRTLVRRFIPRKQIDRPMEQTCHYYEEACSVDISNSVRKEPQRCLVVCTPHVLSEGEIPYYHPSIRALCLSYEINHSAESETEDSGTFSIHFSPFISGLPRFIPFRLQRTLLALLSTHVRLSRKPFAAVGPPKPRTLALKDNIIPQHVVQNTYSRLKQTYAAPLINSWVETTEPSKHVFEDIAIAAFLIELWRGMYGSPDPKQEAIPNGAKDSLPIFPGFVDIACGNGVLTYILHSEGYDGWGFDARRRKSWSIFPASTQDRLKQIICLPKPFKDVLENMKDSILKSALSTATDLHDGIFDKDTFIISNHADELTVWTPLLGALSNRGHPLPFLAIPCCSHAISGMRYRYPAPASKQHPKKDSNGGILLSEYPTNNNSSNNHVTNASPATRHEKQEARQQKVQETEKPPSAAAAVQQNPQSLTGDLKALRALKLEERTNPDNQSSMYSSLTAKVMQVAEEVGYGSDIEKTLLRIPSTRNIGIIGGVKRVMVRKGRGKEVEEDGSCLQLCLNGTEMGVGTRAVEDVMEGECEKDGGVGAAAKLWLKRSLGLQEPQGRGRLKWAEKGGQ